ncbi:hypothetical protein BRADI_2g41420v3 [Brachypodium distachyon]|uniref:GRF-type domain-containing protein n=1 Tax=Brachypodium distachyon TaxID=15368 RepID=I1HNQ3_BRADI|nr:hypothetical protein BRADI_2g41420v3 [Brachypodium distachyon]
MNPDRVFYECLNHRRGGCNFFHWEDGEDNYVDYLVSIGFQGPDIGATEVEDEEEMTKEGEDSGENTGVRRTGVQSVGSNGDMSEIVKKMEELRGLVRMSLCVFVAFLAVMVYAVVLK